MDHPSSRNILLKFIFGSVEPLPDQSANFDREIEEAMTELADERLQRLHPGQPPDQLQSS